MEASSSSTSSSTTLGTATISVKVEDSKDNSFSTKAFLTVSEQPQQNRNVLQLVVWRILNTGGNDDGDSSRLSSWKGSANLTDWQFLKSSGANSTKNDGNNNDMDNIRQQGLSVLMQQSDNDKIQALWSLSSNDDNDDAVLNVAIRDSRKGIKLTPWKTTLTRQSHAMDDCYQALQSVHAELAATKQILDQERSAAAQRHAVLQQAANDYQKTAESLAGTWEREKTELLANFLKLYNARADVLQQQTLEIQQLQQQRDEAQANAAAAGRKTKAAAKSRDDVLQQVPQDDLEFDNDTANLLEQGLPVPYKPVSAAAARKPAANKMHHNQVTGVTEYLDADAAVRDVFGDDSNDDVNNKNKTKKPVKQTVKKEKGVKKQVANKEPPTRKRQTSSSGNGNAKKDTQGAAASAVTERPIKMETESDDATPSNSSKPPPAKKVRHRAAASFSSSDTDSSGPVTRRAKPSPGAPKSTTSQATTSTTTVRRRLAASSSSSSDSDDSNPTRRKRTTQFEKKEKPTPAGEDGDNKATATARDSGSSSVKKDDGSSDADDEDTLVRSQIMSQLAAIKNQEQEEDDDD